MDAKEFLNNQIDFFDPFFEADMIAFAEAYHKHKMDGVEKLISTMENNSVANEAIIANVELWAKSWREELGLKIKDNQHK